MGRHLGEWSVPCLVDFRRAQRHLARRWYGRSVKAIRRALPELLKFEFSFAGWRSIRQRTRADRAFGEVTPTEIGSTFRNCLLRLAVVPSLSANVSRDSSIWWRLRSRSQRPLRYRRPEDDSTLLPQAPYMPRCWSQSGSHPHDSLMLCLAFFQPVEGKELWSQSARKIVKNETASNRRKLLVNNLG